MHEANYGVYGVRKMHAELRRQNLEVGRDQVGRLMREAGLHGVRRGRFKRTTIGDSAAVPGKHHDQHDDGGKQNR